MQRSKAQDGHEGQQHWVWSGCTFLFTLICTVYIISLARFANHGVVENEIEMGQGREESEERAMECVYRDEFEIQ